MPVGDVRRWRLSEKLNEQRGQRRKNLETLQEYIDWCFDVIVMKKNQNACSPAKARRRLPKEVAQQTRLKQHRRRVKAFTDILDSIDKRLSSFDARLSLVEILHREFKSLRESLEFSSSRWKHSLLKTHLYGTRSNL